MHLLNILEPLPNTVDESPAGTGRLNGCGQDPWAGPLLAARVAILLLVDC
jgi:hypothetical protein